MTAPKQKTAPRKWVPIPNGKLNLDHVIAMTLEETGSIYSGLQYYKMVVTVRGEEGARSYHWSWYRDAALAVGVPRAELEERLTVAREREEEIKRRSAKYEREREAEFQRRKALEAKLQARANFDVSQQPRPLADYAPHALIQLCWQAIEADLSAQEKENNRAQHEYHRLFAEEWHKARSASQATG